MNQNEEEKIKGKYRDVLKKDGVVIKDSGWKSNSIAVDYGKFLAALMKKEFKEPVGIEFLAVGDSGIGSDPDAFRNLLVDYFTWLNSQVNIIEDELDPLIETERWAWAKKVKPESMNYLDENDDEVPESSDDITNKLKIKVKITEDEPSDDTLDFKEFALLGIDKKADEPSKYDTARMFLINYVSHGQITKDNTMKLTRTIELTFPINEKS